MCHKLLKRILMVVLSIFLVLSQFIVSFADTKGKMDPDDYIFLLVFRACGVSPGVDVGRWAGLYKGYLKATGNQALLSQVEGYSSLAWGDTVQGVDTLFESVKDWLALSSSYGSPEVGYNLSSAPAPQDVLSPPDFIAISTIPFSDLLVDYPGYTYSLSQTWELRNSLRRYNYYFPEDAQVIGIVNNNSNIDYYDCTKVYFYKVDDSSPAGYSAVGAKTRYCYFDKDGELTFVDGRLLETQIGPDTCSIANLPFPVFGNAADAQVYCKTGIANNTFTSNSGFLISQGESYGLDPELQKKGIAEMGSTIVLPGSLEDANTKAGAFQKPLGREELINILNQNGIQDVLYSAAYKVEHLIESTKVSASGNLEWEIFSEETFSGVSGRPAEFHPLDLEGYTYVPEMTEPENTVILEDGSLVVRLYYKSDSSNPYTSFILGVFSLVNSVIGFWGNVILWLLIPFVLFLFIKIILRFFKRSVSSVSSEKPERKQKNKLLTRRGYSGRKNRKYGNRRRQHAWRKRKNGGGK